MVDAQLAGEARAAFCATRPPGHHARTDTTSGFCLFCELDAGSFAEMARHVRALGEEVEAPVGVVLEAGYALEALAASVAVTLEALAGDEAPESAAPDFVTGRAASYIGHHWTL
jgi:acetoin utilization deacetylase AcuC-like enzyme